MHQKYLLSCAHRRLSEEVGKLIYIHPQQLSFSLSILWPSVVFRSLSLASTHYSSSGLENRVLDSIFLHLQSRSVPGDSKDASVATKKGRFFHCHFDFAIFHCTCRSQCGSSERRGAPIRRQLDRFCREMVRLPISSDHSDLRRFF